MKTKHTPGKWYYWLAASTIYIDGPDGALIAAVHTEDGAEAKANAALIAAAPELLDALAELTSAASAVWEIIDGDRDKQEAWAKELQRIDVAAEAAKRLLQQVRYGEQ